MTPSQKSEPSQKSTGGSDEPPAGKDTFVGRPVRTLQEYHDAAMRTAGGADIVCVALGMAGEAGEFADLVKKIVYHEHEHDRERLIKEAGDVLWYVTAAAHLLGVDLDLVANRNLRKLEARYPAGFSPEASRERVDQKGQDGGGTSE
jgi:NTP pyrophosphatase (non-canonical NTP hydrolase)